MMNISNSDKVKLLKHKSFKLNLKSECDQNYYGIMITLIKSVVGDDQIISKSSTDDFNDILRDMTYKISHNTVEPFTDTSYLFMNEDVIVLPDNSTIIRSKCNVFSISEPVYVYSQIVMSVKNNYLHVKMYMTTSIQDDTNIELPLNHTFHLDQSTPVEIIMPYDVTVFFNDNSTEKFLVDKYTTNDTRLTLINEKSDIMVIPFTSIKKYSIGLDV